MTVGELVMRWSVRLAVAAYLITMALQLRRGDQGHAERAARWCWTIGFVLFVVHVLLAFAVVHDWSHAAAYAETARQTEALFGLDWGGGVWFNYAFLLIWALDAAYWWIAGLERYRLRAGWIVVVLQAWFVFMIVNGAIVFGSGWVRWMTLAAMLTLAIVAGVAFSRRRFDLKMQGKNGPADRY